MISKWLWVLPTIHLAACLTIWIAKIESGVHYLIYADFPLSLFIVILGWRNDAFLLLFAVMGTAWWYGIAYFGERFLRSLT